MVELIAGKAGDGGGHSVDAPDLRRRVCSVRRGHGASSGFSYVEVLVAIVLVGVTVIAALVGLRATVLAGRVGSERSQLLLWVQEGSQAVHRTSYVPCSPAGTMSSAQADAIRSTYQAAIDAVPPPDGLGGGTLVVGEPQYLSIDPVLFTERWEPLRCDPSFEVTLMRLTATSADGTTTELEVIVDG